MMKNGWIAIIVSPVWVGCMGDEAVDHSEELRGLPRITDPSDWGALVEPRGELPSRPAPGDLAQVGGCSLQQIFAGTCLPSLDDLDSPGPCGDSPCAPGVECDNVIDPVTGSPTYSCGACPIGTEGDGEICERHSVYVFATSTVHVGSALGDGNADEICNARAHAAGLGGEWTAFLSYGPDELAPDRVLQFDGPYRNMAGEVIADRFQETEDSQAGPVGILDQFGNPSGLDADINYNEYGELIGTPGANTHVWTGFSMVGTLGEICGDAQALVYVLRSRNFWAGQRIHRSLGRRPPSNLRAKPAVLVGGPAVLLSAVDDQNSNKLTQENRCEEPKPNAEINQAAFPPSRSRLSEVWGSVPASVLLVI